MCPLPPVSSKIAIHAAVPSGYLRQAVVAGQQQIPPLTETVMLDFSKTRKEYQVLCLLPTGVDKVCWVPKAHVCIKYPVEATYSDESRVLTFRYHMVSMESTRGLSYTFKLDGNY